jgi:hypothetical protein
MIAAPHDSGYNERAAAVRPGGFAMDRKLLVLLLVLAVALVAAAVLVTRARYEGPAGAATGNGGGCGNDYGEESDVGEEEAGVVLADGDDDEAPAQVTYRQLVGGVNCLVLTIEPADRIATVDDLCTEGADPHVLDLDDEQAAQIVKAYAALKPSRCDSASCQTGERVEILTSAEEKFFLPFQSPLREPVEKLLALYGEATAGEETEGGSGGGPAEAPPAAASPAAELTLLPEQGAVFANSAAVGQASPLKVDLICYASSKTVDLQAGAGPTMAKQKHLKLFRTPGGTAATFGGLQELPADLPADDDRDMVHNAEGLMGFVVENNVSPGYTRVWVKEASAGNVVLQYQVVSE